MDGNLDNYKTMKLELRKYSKIGARGGDLLLNKLKSDEMTKQMMYKAEEEREG